MLIINILSHLNNICVYPSMNIVFWYDWIYIDLSFYDTSSIFLVSIFYYSVCWHPPAVLHWKWKGCAVLIYRLRIFVYFSTNLTTDKYSDKHSHEINYLQLFSQMVKCLNNICLREVYITLLEKLLYWVHVYRHFYFLN